MILPDPFPGWGTLKKELNVDLALKHDATLCVKADCEICKPTGRLTSELDYQREMCPKHGIAHGVCVDPIKTGGGRPSVTGEPAQYTCSTGTSRASCTFCGGPITDRPHICRGLIPYEAPDTSPNRFCPFEALDGIVDTAQKVASDPVYFTEIIRNRVYALRAYITGMER